MFNLIVAVRDPITGDMRELKRQFDPALLPATLQSKWTGLGPAVLTMINELTAAAAADTTAPPPL